MNRRTEDANAGLTEHEPILGRWSRRKQAAQKGGLEATPETERKLSDENDDSGDDEYSQDTRPPLTDADMPSLKDLDGDSDYAGFLSPEVSEELRRLALRQLFHSAQFNICDGLDDYDEDFTSFEKLGDIVTADMKHRMEIEKEQDVEKDKEIMDKEKKEQKEDTESALLEPKPEDDTDASIDESDQELEGVAEDIVDGDTDIEEATQLSENDDEIDNQSELFTDNLERSSS